MTCASESKKKGLQRETFLFLNQKVKLVKETSYFFTSLKYPFRSEIDSKNNRLQDFYTIQ